MNVFLFFFVFFFRLLVFVFVFIFYTIIIIYLIGSFLCVPAVRYYRKRHEHLVGSINEGSVTNLLQTSFYGLLWYLRVF